jgi:hypothetical protein
MIKCVKVLSRGYATELCVFESGEAHTSVKYYYRLPWWKRLFSNHRVYEIEFFVPAFTVFCMRVSKGVWAQGSESSLRVLVEHGHFAEASRNIQNKILRKF